ncbi:hypothetical protein BTJ68_10087 [Hortaea werneckii EXF-2000]|uniref:Tyrosine specific protein phosphatases domain-containing protein n=1 Tax=Hortaea werneckii EXF-2000 TaxID=1157616 RepID=A0A1Z5T338_HORWE|nr:hypothetical protein BTJ68_10087 [Hortaea werneckii EXF-2000]
MASAELDAFTYPHKTAEYSYRVPTPPRIVITLNALRSANFLSAVNYHNLVSQNAVLEWTYERRREAQMILPYLYLGPMPVCKDEAFLKGEKNHQTHDQRPAPHHAPPTNRAPPDRPHLAPRPHRHLPAHHRPHHRPPRHHYATTGRIGKVLVFCESGNERSAAVVAAYLMEVHADVDFIKAMQLVQAQRFCVNFDDGIKRLLQGYWDILCARRQVERVAEGGVGRA